MPLLNQKFFRDKKIQAIRESMHALYCVYGDTASLVIDINPASFLARKYFSLNPENDGVGEEIFITEYAGDVFNALRKSDGVRNSNIASILRTPSTVENIFKNSQKKGGKGGSFFYFTSDK